MIQRMLDRFDSTVELSGTINLTVSDGAGVNSATTTVAMSRPSRLAIRQEVRGQRNRVDRYLFVSNGTQVLYSLAAVHTLKDKVDYVTEDVRTKTGYLRMIPELYLVARAAITDNEVLNFMFRGPASRRGIEHHFATVRTEEKETVRGIEANVFTGSYRKEDSTVVSGTYKIWISDSLDLLRYEVTLPMVNPRNSRQRVDVKQTWEIDIKIEPSGGVPASAFALKP
jgi:hypothetical protein